MESYWILIHFLLLNFHQSLSSRLELYFISNLPPNKIDSAIQSRSLFIDVNLTRESVILRIKSILKVIHLDVSDEEKFAIVDALSENSSTLTMRAVEAAMAIKKAGINDWERLVSQYV